MAKTYTPVSQVTTSGVKVEPKELGASAVCQQNKKAGFQSKKKDFSQWNEKESPFDMMRSKLKREKRWFRCGEHIINACPCAADVTCNHCGKKGHTSMICCFNKLNFGQSESKDVKSDTNVFKAGMPEEPVVSAPDPLFHYFAASASVNVSQDLTHQKEVRVIGDSGCSKNLVGHYHICRP
eukprot:GHVR01096481.1.p1 GENE.GHVR01096481.1~~GHVR01096481.1.p1  ORF type:complete len:181 (-),score=23.87 GHVR01096481.1:856-1398(-)